VTAQRYRLAPDTLIEPLVRRWPAWWLTVAPVPACLQLVGFQIPLLKSYLQNPEFHARGEREVNGSAFVGIPAARASEVRALLAEHMVGDRDRIALAVAFEELEQKLIASCSGESLQPLYAAVPPPLRGLVELVYDYRNRASIRVLEAVSYQNGHAPTHQALRLSRLENEADRRTFFTTPRLPDPAELDWQLAFTDPRVDALFRLDLEPAPLDEIEALVDRDASGADVARFVALAAPGEERSWTGPGVRATYIQHACVLLEHGGTSVLIDPVISPRPAGRGGIGFADLPPRIDYALITHAHADHFHIETLLRLRHRIGRLVVPRASGLLVGDVSLRRMALALGFPDVIELDWFETLPLPTGGAVVAAPFLGEHGDLAHAKNAYVVRLQPGGTQVLFAADSTCLDDACYRRLVEAVGPISTVFLNTEVEGSPLTFTIEAIFPRSRDRRREKTRTCRGSNAAEGLALARALGARRLYNYAMGLEPALSYIVGPPSPPDSPRMRESDALLAAARDAGIHAERLCGTRVWQLDGESP
jgi:glyoxylase-like metal-dependent hydrolase (beta-lactamase superfamily II)